MSTSSTFLDRSGQVTEELEQATVIHELSLDGVGRAIRHVAFVKAGERLRPRKRPGGLPKASQEDR